MENKLYLKKIKVEGKEIVVTDSRIIAQNVDIRHDNLLKKIKNYEETMLSSKIRAEDFFIESSYKDSNNQERPCYLLTKDGCEMVANKMTGKKGILFTATYVKAFNDMQDQLKAGQANFATKEDMFIYQLQEQKKIKQQLNEVNHKALSAKQDIEKLKKDFINYKENQHISGAERDEISSLVKAIGTRELGGKGSKAYKDESLRRKVYSNIYRELYNQFNITSYKYIRAKYFTKAKEIVYNYRLTIALKEAIELTNSQIQFEEAK